METAVYVHVPYCRSKCSYCDFLSFPLAAGSLGTDEYLTALEAELALRGRELAQAGYRVATLYIGGGTPTALTVGQLDRLLGACRYHLPLTAPEWTVEANPGTFDAGKAAILSRHGVNRVSLGVQDLDGDRLALLGRTHTSEEAYQAFALCRDNFASVSVDLMAGLPRQTAENFSAALAAVLAWGPDHLSLYSLKLEEGTSLALLVATGDLTLPGEDEVAEMLLAARRQLSQAGYVHYEIANFARLGHECCHNRVYWQNKPYLGIGLGAHSYWERKRLVNTVELPVYTDLLARRVLPVAEEVLVTERQVMEDTFMLGLRLLSGVSFADFAACHGREAREVFAGQLARLERLGLLFCDGEYARLTAYGLSLANVVFAEFVS
ncbi:MAG: radical SAM family heme chaperone HemW [Dethiobacter sp.]|nr:radical SAM family heme chaperone HemW [Dethiobacter sp.]